MKCEIVLIINELKNILNIHKMCIFAIGNVHKM